MGKKKSPCYRIIVSDSRGTRDGKYIENLGTYNPSEADKVKKLSVKKERLGHWVTEGAVLSGTVRTLLSNFEIKEITEPSKKSVKKNKRKNRNNPIKDRVKKEKFVPKPKKEEKSKDENPKEKNKNEQISKNPKQDSQQVDVKKNPDVVKQKNVDKTEINEKENKKEELEKAKAVEGKTESVDSKVSSESSVDEPAEKS